MTSWKSFTAFGGTINSLFFAPRFNAEGGIDYEATSLSFWQWFQGLRQSPVSYGIPQSRIEDVRKLLDSFFPEVPAGQRVTVRRLASQQSTPFSQRTISPILVHFGTANESILIADAPNALCYIFSVVSPPPGVAPGLQDYLVPLFVCYAWALHQACWWPPSADFPVITNVPDQACLLYLPSSTGPPTDFCFGATWSGADPPDPVGAGMRDNDEMEMDRWRRAEMLAPLFAASLPPKANPLWSPYARQLTARRLNEYILGRPGNDSAVTPFLDPLFMGALPSIPGVDVVGLTEYIRWVAVMIKAETINPLGVTVEPDFLISHTKLGPVLLDLLFAVLDTMDRAVDEIKLLGNLQKLVQFYLMPHILDPLSGQELPLGPQSKPIVEGLANSLPTILLPSLRKKLRSLSCHLQNIHESQDYKIMAVEILYFIRDTKPCGRSPEAFPLYALYNGQPKENRSLGKLSSLRGMRLNLRPLGQGILAGGFEEGFSAANLDEMSFPGIEGQAVKDAVVAPPDAEGSILVQLALNRPDGKHGPYSDDAKAVCPKTMALFQDEK